jgi:hypothetical protein
MPSFNSRVETAIPRRKQTTPPIFSCANRFAEFAVSLAI